jgi:hypothetical protein
LESCSDGALLFTRTAPQNKAEKALLFTQLNGDCRAVFAFRSLLDTVVSRYQSFTQNHGLKAGLSSAETAAELKKRQREHALGADIWALEHWPSVVASHRNSLNTLRDFRKAGCGVMASHYEGMVTDPDRWVGRVARFMGIPEESSAATKSSRPTPNAQWAFLQRMASVEKKVVPSKSSHTAFFYPGEYQKHLNASTVARLVKTLSPRDRPPSWSGDWPLTQPLLSVGSKYTPTIRKDHR